MKTKKKAKKPARSRISKLIQKHQSSYMDFIFNNIFALDSSMQGFLTSISPKCSFRTRLHFIKHYSEDISAALSEVAFYEKRIRCVK